MIILELIACGGLAIFSLSIHKLIKHCSKKQYSKLIEPSLGRLCQVTKDSNEECCICLEYYMKDDIVKKLGCGHFYHAECIENWFLRNVVCPICRVEII